MIRWNEPSWLDEQVTPLKPIDVAGRFAALRAAAEPRRSMIRSHSTCNSAMQRDADAGAPDDADRVR